jgi:hypothetical protein
MYSRVERNLDPRTAYSERERERASTIHYNVSEWSGISSHGLLIQRERES